MATMNISITEEAYKRLASLREGKESFSDIINRVTGRKSIMAFAGILSKESADKIEEHIRKRRAAFDEEAKRRRKDLLRQLS